MQKEENFDYEFKIILLGSSSVGKTCVFQRLTKNEFLKNHTTTIGIDATYNFVKIIDKETKENKTIKIKVMDTAGQERFKSITKNFYKNSNGCILMYDVSNKETFLKVEDWIKDFRTSAGENSKIFLVGNKIDLREEIDNLPQKNNFVSTEEGLKLANTLKFPFREISCLKNIGVFEIFQDMTEFIYEEEKKHKNLDSFLPNNKRLEIVKRNDIRNDVVNKKKCCK